MTNNEIDKRLALAIGYTADRVRTIAGWVYVYNNLFERLDGPFAEDGWQLFDHTDHAVIWPIAERFNAFPNRWRDDECVASIGSSLQYNATHKTDATATALAVIKYVESKALTTKHARISRLGSPDKQTAERYPVSVTAIHL